MTDFDEYMKFEDPSAKEKAYAWATAIGLQAVDGLQTSEYLQQTAQRNIEGDISIEEAQELIHQYYQRKKQRESDDDQKEEADRVSANMTKLLQSPTLNFSSQGYIDIHRHIFNGIFKFAGQIRDYNITKKEWVLRGDTVNYLNYLDIRRALDYEIQKERDFDYKGLSKEEIVSHISRFVSDLWQIHAFGEGNTRTTATFVILYLRSIGFQVSNDLFAKNSWYFRNALVRANYKNATQGISYSYEYIELFFRNLLLGECNILKNRLLLIDPPKDERFVPISTQQAPNKYPTTSSSFEINNENIKLLVQTLGRETLSVKEMMVRLHLKDRVN